MDRSDGWRPYVRGHLDGVCAVAGAFLLIITWYLPWFTMVFPLANPPSAPLPLSPYTLAEDASTTKLAAFLLLVGSIILVLGVGALLRTRSTWRYALWFSLAGLLFLVSVEQVLGAMGVPQTMTGVVAPGVTLVPEPGILLLCGACGCLVGAVWFAWQRVWVQRR